MNQGQGFQFTPFGITALGDASGAIGDEMAPANAEVAKPLVETAIESVAQHLSRVATKRATVAPTQPIRRGNLVTEAKRRIRELKTELKRMARLQKELHELERLVAAAKKPVAVVRSLNAAKIR